jgi:uncharacterized protein YkwD
MAGVIELYGSGSPPLQSTEQLAIAPPKPCPNAGLLPTEEDAEMIREAIICLVNQVRASDHEAPLEVNERLELAAQSHTNSMVSENYFDHVAPDGETPLQRVEGSGYIPPGAAGYVIGENVAWGTGSAAIPQAIVEAWIASPDHLANILESKYRDTAVGVDPSAPPSLSGDEAGATYTQEFGVIETADGL